ncbi:MAG: ATP-binding protein [Vulcanimicrobiaceae bacterium]
MHCVKQRDISESGYAASRRSPGNRDDLLTSNRPLEDWPKLFGDTPAVAAFLDRLMHHSHLIEIRGKSYRLHEHSLAARNRKAKTTA